MERGFSLFWDYLIDSAIYDLCASDILPLPAAYLCPSESVPLFSIPVYERGFGIFIFKS